MKEIKNLFIRITQYQHYILDYAIIPRNSILNLGILLHVQILMVAICSWIIFHFLWEFYLLSFIGMILGSMFFYKLQKLAIAWMHSENYGYMLFLQVVCFFLLSLFLSLFLILYIFQSEIELELVKIYTNYQPTYGIHKLGNYFGGLMILFQKFNLILLVLPEWIVIFFILIYPSFFIYLNQNNLYDKILRNYEQYKKQYQRNK